jgi:DNA polymerase sigma
MHSRNDNEKNRNFSVNSNTSDRRHEDDRSRGKNRDDNRGNSFSRYSHSPVRRRDKSPAPQCQILILGSMDPKFTQNVEATLSQYVQVQTTYLSVPQTQNPVDKLEKELYKIQDNGVNCVIFIERSRQKMGLVSCQIKTPLGIQGSHNLF